MLQFSSHITCRRHLISSVIYWLLFGESKLVVFWTFPIARRWTSASDVIRTDIIAAVGYRSATQYLELIRHEWNQAIVNDEYRSAYWIFGSLSHHLQYYEQYRLSIYQPNTRIGIAGDLLELRENGVNYVYVHVKAFNFWSLPPVLYSLYATLAIENRSDMLAIQCWSFNTGLDTLSYS